MKPNHDRTELAPSRPAAAPAPRRRFRLERLEERIAPKKGGNGTRNCGGSSGSSGTYDCGGY